ncbi:MAG: hypothetical protein PHQ36_05870, partial [Anaerolineales bacterium]|nr:hypothetical protein [Anaerolineales bacterium]
MQLQLLSYNSNILSPNYNGWVAYPAPMGLEAQPDFLEVAGKSSEYTGKSFGGGYLTIQVRYEDDFSNVHLREDEIKRWFNTKDETPYKLLAQDIADDNRQWYTMATPIAIQQDNNSAIIVMALEDPYWRVETVSSSTWSVTDSIDTHNITCIGETAAPVFSVTPFSAKSIGFLNYRFVEVMPPSATKALPSYPLNLGSFNTAALVAGNKALPSGFDFRVMVDGVEIPRWFGSSTAAFGTTQTNIWVTLSWRPAVTFTLGAAIAATGGVSSIQFANTQANRIAIAKLPARGILKIATGANFEYFTYTGKDTTKLTLTGTIRATKLSSPIAHSVNDVCTWIQHDIWFVYNNPAATDPAYSNRNKPMFDLDLSTNTSWTYTEFYEEGTPRAGMWNKSLLSSTLKTSAPYTGPHGSSADPATEAGLRIATKRVNNIEKAETAALLWSINCPAGFTRIASMTGEEYKYTSYKFPIVEVKKSKDAINYVVASTIATATAPRVWQAWSITNLFLNGSYTHLQVSMSGTLPAFAGNEVCYEMQGFTGIVDSSAVPIATINAESSTYYLDAKITNLNTGKAIFVTYAMKLGSTLTVDCSTRSVTYGDGTNAHAA